MLSYHRLTICFMPAIKIFHTFFKYYPYLFFYDHISYLFLIYNSSLSICFSFLRQVNRNLLHIDTLSYYFGVSVFFLAFVKSSNSTLYLSLSFSYSLTLSLSFSFSFSHAPSLANFSCSLSRPLSRSLSLSLSWLSRRHQVP